MYKSVIEGVDLCNVTMSSRYENNQISILAVRYSMGQCFKFECFEGGGRGDIRRGELVGEILTNGLFLTHLFSYNGSSRLSTT